MEDRLKELRKYLNLSQNEFSERIMVGSSTLAMWELGTRKIKDIHISKICSEFKVNEEWLRTGKGDMIIQVPEDDELAAYCGEICAGKRPFIEKVVLEYMRLDDDSQKIINKFITSITK